jgi:hypothetical protein
VNEAPLHPISTGEPLQGIRNVGPEVFSLDIDPSSHWLHYRSVTIDGHQMNWDGWFQSGAVPPGWSNTLGIQYQLDSNGPPIEERISSVTLSYQ